MTAPVTEPLRILYINQSVDIGGIENLILELIRAQPKEEYRPMVCVFEANGFLENEFRAAGAQVFVLRKRAGLDITLPFRLMALIRKSGAQLLHTHNQSSWLYAVLANLLLRRPLLHTVHSSVSQNPARAVRWKKIEQALSLFTDRIIPVADSIARYMVSEQNISKAKIEVIHNGIKTRLYQHPDDATRTRAGLPFPANAYRVGNVARLNTVKDQATLLKAFARVALKVPETHLLLVGDGPLREPLERLAAELQVSARVCFLGNRRDVPELLHAMDLFVLSSLREGFPVAILEALAAGVPVIATRVDGCMEVIEDRVNGLLVSPSDPETLADAIFYCHQNRQHANAMAAKGRMVVEEKFTFEIMINKYLSNYRKLLK